MLKKLTLFAVALLSATFSIAQNTPTPDSYHFKVNLQQVAQDQLTVELTVPESVRQQSTATYHLPKIVPGTYAIYNFGRFASQLKAFDKSGKPLKAKWIKKTDDNTWVIAKPAKLYKITYTVEDTWDTDKDPKLSPKYIFEPAGTNIEAGKNFVLNNNGFFGYFEGLERKPFFVEIDRPANFFGATSMLRKGGDADTDLFFVEDYMGLVDAPIMFNQPDTAIVKVGKADVLISVYSPTRKVSAKFVAGEIAPILQAQKAYLGGELPVDRYAFIIYLAEKAKTNSGGFGALEHSYSSFYFLPEAEPSYIAQTVRDVAAHEFFHIVTPLNIHSEEIHYFDYINPKMSEHLWLYEGVTEYSASHVQVKHGLMPLDDYLKVLTGKMKNAAEYNEALPFTQMSKGCLEEYKDQYTNVYEKGALIGLCLDLKLRQLSGGARGIQELMRDLAKEYGKQQPFKDSELFDKIAALTHPEVGAFLRTHVAGNAPLPIKELTAAAGIQYFERKNVLELSPLGGITGKNIGFDGKNFTIANTNDMDAFGLEKIGFKEGDILVAWNGSELNPKSINEVLGSYIMSAKEGDQLSVVVVRGGERVTLKAVLEKVEVSAEHVFLPNPNASDAQLALRKAWLGV